MATVKICDFCKGHPNDCDAKSGGDVRAVTLDIQDGDSVERRTFDGCGTCRTRLLGEILENISVRPPKVAEAPAPDVLEALRRLGEINDRERAKQPKRNIPIPAAPWPPSYPAHPYYWSAGLPRIVGE